MHSSNLLKLAPFLSLSPGQGIPCGPASSREPGQGEDLRDPVHVSEQAAHCTCGAMAVISDPVGGPTVEREFREKHKACGGMKPGDAA